MGARLKGQDSYGFLQLNRNKRSVELNLKTDARELLVPLDPASTSVRTNDGRVGPSGRPGAP